MRAVRVPLLLGLLVALLGACGSDDEGATDAADPASVSSSASSPSGSASGSAEETGAGGTSGGEDCASAQLEIEAGVSFTGNVSSVEVPSCDEATVTTTFGPTDVDPAVGLCGIAATQASGQGVARVRILAADGTVLATGTDSADCAAA